MFKKIIAAAKAWCLKIFTSTTTQVPAKTSDEVLTHVIAIVNTVKDAVNSKTATIITALIPGTVDDYLRSIAAMVLPVTIAGLTYLKGVVNHTPDDALVAQALDRVRLAVDEDQNAFYHSLAARLLVIFSDGRVTWSEAVGIVEYYFQNKYLITK